MRGPCAERATAPRASASPSWPPSRSPRPRSALRSVRTARPTAWKRDTTQPVANAVVTKFGAHLASTRHDTKPLPNEQLGDVFLACIQDRSEHPFHSWRALRGEVALVLRNHLHLWPAEVETLCVAPKEEAARQVRLQKKTPSFRSAPCGGTLWPPLRTPHCGRSPGPARGPRCSRPSREPEDSVRSTVTHAAPHHPGPPPPA